MIKIINPSYINSNTSNSTFLYTDRNYKEGTITSKSIKDRLISQEKVFSSVLKEKNYPFFKNSYCLSNPIIYKYNKLGSNLTNIKRFIPEESGNFYRPLVYQETSIFNLEISEYNNDFQKTINSLLELKEIDPDLDEDDEDEIYYPSNYAFFGSIQLLNKLYEILGVAFPSGFASLESRGGVDLIWKNKILDKQVWFKFPVDNSFQSSVYYRQGDKSNLIKQPETIFMAKLLQWLFTEDSLDN